MDFSVALIQVAFLFAFLKPFFFCFSQTSFRFLSFFYTFIPPFIDSTVTLAVNRFLVEMSSIIS